MAGRALVLSPEQEAEVRQDVLSSAHRALDARTAGAQNFPVFLRECLERRVWEQERRFQGGTIQKPISFEDFIRKQYPVGLGSSYEAVERIISGDSELESLWGMVTGRAVVPHTPDTLPELERVIGDGLRTFVEVGRSLAKIRDSELYKEGGHKTFEAYCRERWDFSKQRAYELIRSSVVVERVRNSVPELSAPENPGQAVELAKLPATEQAPAWEEAVRTAPEGKVTARHVAEVVSSRMQPANESTGDIAERSAPSKVVKIGPVDRALGIVRNMSEEEVYEFKKRFNGYLRERAKEGSEA